MPEISSIPAYLRTELIKPAKLEAAEMPALKFVVALMFGVFDGLDQLSVAPGTAALLRRAAAADFGQARVDYAGFRICEPLDLDRMLPAVAEVIEILQRFVPGLRARRQAWPCGRRESRCPNRRRHRACSIRRRARGIIEVGVGPAHGRLDREMQAVEPDIERHLDAAQNRGPTSSRVILRRAMVSALMPPVYDAPSQQPSSMARVRRACGWHDR